MVVNAILAYFLNNILNSSFFSLKFWISHYQRTYKIIWLFISLSCYRALISNAIYESQRSLNMPSTPSQLRFVRSSPIPLPPLSLSPPILPSNQRCNSEMSPSPLLRDVGSNSNTQTCLEMPALLHPPLPFPEGCGRLKFAWRKNGVGKYMRGDPGFGRPRKCIKKTNHDLHHGSFSSFFHSFHWTDCPYAQCLQTQTTMFVVVHFSNYLLIPDHPHPLCQRTYIEYPSLRP